ncbi:MAG TPA: jacalin-like lectin [Myxococcales bacterium]|nr:jacalin-like lectin [Myxococcales bacterium]
MLASLVLSTAIAASAAPPPARSFADASPAAIAQAFRPRINFNKTQRCWPLTYQEISPTASTSDRDGMKKRCNKSYNESFVMFASVKRPSSGAPGPAGESFRITYGVAFGWQTGSFTGLTQDLIDKFGDAGDHDQDAQYIVVDVVDGKAVSVWADLHQGHYARVRSQLTWHDGDHVVAWAGPYYNSLKLVSDTTSVCSVWSSVPTTLQALCAVPCKTGKSCGLFDTLMNFGDKPDSDKQGDGKLVMVDDLCKEPGTSYKSPEGITYSGTQLDALKAYIGCKGTDTPGAWKGYFMKKPQYTEPYKLSGCDSGNKSGGTICNATLFAEGETWTTFADSNRVIDPTVAGNADVDYSAGAPFNDLPGTSEVPAAITVRGGNRIDAVSVTYQGGAVKSHGGTGGDAKKLDGLEKDPVVSVSMCEGSKDGRERAGSLKLTTRSGRSLSAGKGTSKCTTVAPPNKKLLGFYGRSGSEIDVLGTYWGNL